MLSPAPKLVLLSGAYASVCLRRTVVSETWILFVYTTVGYLLSPNALLLVCSPCLFFYPGLVVLYYPAPPNPLQFKNKAKETKQDHIVYCIVKTQVIFKSALNCILYLVILHRYLLSSIYLQVFLMSN